VPTVSESGSAHGQFKLSRSGSLSEPLHAEYAIGGSATTGADDVALSGIITFAAGSSTATIDVVPHRDGIVEGDETVMLTLTANRVL
jgi:uncharacterized Zn-binding protein involved in type VI secretion